MKTENLFELTYLILEKKQVTASQLAEHFGVSQRTIYRWVESLNLAGVPIMTAKGKGGGIQIAEKYALDKAFLTENEQQEILSSVQALQVLSGRTNSAVSKLKAITKANADWIQVDFAPWNPEQAKIRNLFGILKSAILGRKQISMEYSSAKGEHAKRIADPWKLIYKGQAWYLYGYCMKRKSPRYFKLSRMQDVKILKNEISLEEKDFKERTPAEYHGDKISSMIQLKAKVRNSELYRILDEYNVTLMKDSGKKCKVVIFDAPDIYWLKHWILSFGSSMEILEPEKMRLEIQDEIKKMWRQNTKKSGNKKKESKCTL